jgi:PhnB protein
MTNAAQPASGAHTTNGRPHGYSSITPFLALERPGDALDFYQRVFGATCMNSSAAGDVIVHAELDFGNGRLQLGAAVPDYHLVAPNLDSDDVAFSLALYCPDVDAVVERAVAAGAVVREPVAEFVSGDRFASIRDPFGIRWSVMTRVEDLSDAESDARVKEWLASQG